MITCPKHPKYKGLRKPRYKSKGSLEKDCCTCYLIYLAVKEDVNLAWVVKPDGTKSLVEG